MAQQFLIYQNLNQDPIIAKGMAVSLEKPSPYRRRRMESLVGDLIFYSGTTGPLYSWKDYVVWKVLESENRFTRSMEEDRIMEESLQALVLRDLKRIQRLLDLEWREHQELDSWLRGVFQPESTDAFLGKSGKQLLESLKEYHKLNGTGQFVRKSVFKVSDLGYLLPLEHYDPVEFSQLIGYERQIKSLRQNVEGFLEGRGSNNMLLYGDRGTGKSSSVKALLQAYKDKGLRVIEMKKNQFALFPKVLEEVRNRRQKFMVFIDDLSFEPNETSYKELKAVLEGSFESKPENIMMVVTSNRRHLIKESFADRETDLHVRETVGEQLSLFDRFGLIIYFDQPSETLYRDMVLEMARREKIRLSEEDLLRLANEWKVGKGTKSGRSVRQFIDSLRRES